MSKTKKRYGVISFDVHTEPTGWEVIAVFRYGDGGTDSETFARGKFQDVLTLMNQLVDTYGVER